MGHPQGLLTERGYRELQDALEWGAGVEVSPPWRAFIEELEGAAYAAFLKRVLGTLPDLRSHWHYTPRGCSVSPHCDSKHKLGSHLFYFNDSSEWDPSWGGETLILEDDGHLHSDSHPDFDDFERSYAANALDNHSLIFLRKGNSWHGVGEITCPEGRLRKVFIVVFEKPRLWRRIGHRLGLGNAEPA